MSGPPRVLLADDNEGIRNAFTRLLESSCDVVGHVSNGAQLLETIEQLRPNVVVLDLKMPGIDGLRTCRQMKTTAPDVEVIVCTADDDPSLRGAAVEAGASAFVSKFRAGEDLAAAVLRTGSVPLSAAQVLRESEELHRLTLLSMSDAVFVTTDEGAFTFICPNVDVIFGYCEDDVRAMGRMSQLFGRDLLAFTDLASTGEVRNIEHEVVAKDGTHRVLLVHIKRVSIKRGTTMYVCRDITERKQADDVQRRNEEQLRLALQAANAGTWDWDVSTGDMHWSAETHRMFGDATLACSPSLQSFLDRVHPLDRERVASTMSGAVDRATTYETEFRVLGLDEVERWVLGKGKALNDGTPRRMLGVFLDITAGHRVESELRDLGGRLIDAHERERRRLSGELHDGIGQRVALLSAELAMLRGQLASAPLIVAQVNRLLAHTEDVGTELHRLSHDLHPAWLERAGLAASIRRVCTELASAHRIAIDVESAEVPEQLTGDVELCLYRIVQEALHNVVKHSGATRVTVRLEVDLGEIVLDVVDDGQGFDPVAERPTSGVGLVSMRERVRQVDGSVTLTSKPGSGTHVHVRVPLGGSTTGDAGVRPHSVQ